MLEKIIDKFDQYTREARIFPAVIALSPFYLLFLSFVDFSSHIDTYIKIPLAFILYSALAYFFAEITRNLGKALETETFGEEMFFPTTELLLHSDKTFSHDKKERIYSKIKKDFGIDLLTESQEKNDKNDARKRIREAVGQIRQKLGNGRLLLQYNIRYGFWRNLCACSPFSTGASGAVFLAVMFVSHNTVIAIISFVLFLLYFFLWKKDKGIIKYFGYQYANQVYLEFLTPGDEKN